MAAYGRERRRNGGGVQRGLRTRAPANYATPDDRVMTDIPDNVQTGHRLVTSRFNRHIRRGARGVQPHKFAARRNARDGEVARRAAAHHHQRGRLI